MASLPCDTVRTYLDHSDHGSVRIAAYDADDTYSDLPYDHEDVVVVRRLLDWNRLPVPRRIRAGWNGCPAAEVAADLMNYHCLVR